jgi:hypothetical protein
MDIKIINEQNGRSTTYDPQYLRKEAKRILKSNSDKTKEHGTMLSYHVEMIGSFVRLVVRFKNEVSFSESQISTIL